jgi:hypothetical protein
MVLIPNHQTPLDNLIRCPSSTISMSVTIRSRSPDHQVLQRLRLTWSTWSTLPNVHLLVNVPKCQPPTVSPSAILVPRSRPHVYSSPLLVHRYDTSLLDLLHVRR